jgi:L-threonylcarbamoyladenylate synthase
MTGEVVEGLSHVEEAVALLRRGGLVALPTETVYGLAADAEDELAVRRIFAAKGRPSAHPLIVHLADAGLASGWCRAFPEGARRLAAAFWPGPLTLVLPRGPRALDVVTGGQDTVALRVPSHPVAHAVLASFGGGLAMPSANRFGRTSPTRAEHVAEDLGGAVDLILDGGPCEVGVESTIVDLSGPSPALLRPGGVAREALEEVLGASVPMAAPGGVRAPGTLPSHYAPRAGVVLAEAGEVQQKVAELSATGAKVGLVGPRQAVPGAVVALEAPADAEGLARVLYAMLREGDARGCDVLVVQVPPEHGVGLAVRDRLRRAAAPRA